MTLPLPKSYFELLWGDSARRQRSNKTKEEALAWSSDKYWGPGAAAPHARPLAELRVAVMHRGKEVLETKRRLFDAQRLSAPNAGLIFDRAPYHWSEDDEPAARRDHLNDVVAYAASANPLNSSAWSRQLDELLRRTEALVTTLGGRSFELALTWRLVSGLGATHVLDNGFVWDRNLGVPYLPGSTVKGLVHAWAKHWVADTPADYQACYARLFGDTDDPGVGRVIVHDAFPLNADVLELDVMTMHASRYYRSPRTEFPVDSESPKPVHFLTVKPDTRFRFALSPRQRDGDHEQDLLRADDLLRAALQELGIGSKTAVGYGHFEQ